jgi:hypothetical protein
LYFKASFGSGTGHFGVGTQTGFVGFSTKNGDLGWLRVKVETPVAGTKYPDSLEVIDGAYNDVAGQPITAGQTTSTPEPGTAALGLLATGATGLLAWRKRRSASSAE